jgi:uncharacterized membrane protein YdbT with pleckstrin-like domain
MAYVDDNLGSDEHVIYRTRLHWVCFLGPTVFLALFLLIIAFLASSPELVAVGFAAIAILLFLWLLVESIASLRSYLTSEFAVTNRRVLLKKVGWRRQKTEETDLKEVDNIGVEQGLVGRILGYGSVTIAELGRPKVSFSRVAHAVEFGEHVYQQIIGKRKAPPL